MSDFDKTKTFLAQVQRRKAFDEQKPKHHTKLVTPKN